jgi:hypothetical protein
MNKIRLIYLYLFAAVGLVTVIIGTVRMVDLGLKVFVFQNADKYEIYPSKLPDGQPELTALEMQARQDRETRRNRERDLVAALSMLVVGLPVYLYHWKTIQHGS